MNKLDSKKMKTKFIMTTFVVAVAMISAINVFNANKNETLSDIVGQMWKLWLLVKEMVM